MRTLYGFSGSCRPQHIETVLMGGFVALIEGHATQRIGIGFESVDPAMAGNATAIPDSSNQLPNFICHVLSATKRVGKHSFLRTETFLQMCHAFHEFHARLTWGRLTKIWMSTGVTFNGKALAHQVA